MTPAPSIVAAFLAGALARVACPRHTAELTAIVFLLAAWIARRRGDRRSVWCIVLAACLAGVGVAQAVPSLVPRELVPTGAELVEARVVRGCTHVESGWRCVVERADRSRIGVTFDSAGCRARPGDLVTAIVTLSPNAPMWNDGLAGPGAAAFRDGIRLRGRSSSCEITGRAPTLIDLVRRAALWLRERIDDGIDTVFDRRHRGAARALLFGDDAGLEPDVVTAFRTTGLAHLLAVSGAHVALLASAIGALVSVVARRIPALASRGLVGPLTLLAPIVPVAWFVFCTGESPSAMRALASTLLAALAGVFGRKPHGESVVALSAAITAVARPAWLFDPGWQLSVVAGWALSVPFSRDRGTPADSSPSRLAIVGSIGRILVESLATSARVGIASAAVLLHHFGRVPVAALSANAIAAPIGEVLCLPLTLVAGVFGCVLPFFGRVVAWPASVCLDALMSLPTAALRLPFASGELCPPNWAQCCTVTFFVLMFSRARWRGRLAAACALLVIVGAMEHRVRAHARPIGVLRVTALDVGQGDAILVDLPDGEAMLIDAGGDPTGRTDIGERIVGPVLAARRRTTLSLVVASHPHPDHVGGIAAVLRRSDVGELWDTGQGAALGWTGGYAAMLRAARERSVAIRGPAQLCGPARAFHGVRLRVIAPCPALDPNVAPNDASFVMHLAFGRSSVLLVGDLERAGEERILAEVGPVTLLKVGHHGSRTSTTDAFLARVRPRVALVSAGHPSPFSHPHGSTLARLRGAGVAVAGTYADGAVGVTLVADGSWRWSR